MIFQEVEKEVTALPVEGREGPDGEEGEESGTPPQPPPSPENVTSGEVSGNVVSVKGGGCVVTSLGVFQPCLPHQPASTIHRRRGTLDSRSLARWGPPRLPCPFLTRRGATLVTSTTMLYLVRGGREKMV